MPLIRKPSGQAPQQIQRVDDILKSLRDPDPDRRWAAARDAVSVAGAGDALAAALRAEQDPRVRGALFTSLAGIGTPQAADAVVALLRSDDANLRTGALDTLQIMTAQVHDLLPKLLRDQDVDVRILSCELVRSLASAEASALMCQVLENDADANVCAAAVDVLAEAGGADALPSLHACARRFRGAAFLEFAIEVVIERISAEASAPRA